MVLTGPEIARQVELNNIFIKPFNSNQLNPNSYNYRIGETILIPKDNNTNKNDSWKRIHIPKEGFVLEPRMLYLSSTYEVIGSNKFSMNLIGRSSIGRLGLYLQLSAPFGHTGSCQNWTLELHVVQRLRIYPKMIIGQVSFWSCSGDISKYIGAYFGNKQPTPCKDENL